MTRIGLALVLMVAALPACADEERAGDPDATVQDAAADMATDDASALDDVGSVDAEPEDAGPINHAPLATDDKAEVSGAGALLLTVLYNDGDYDGDKLKIVSATQPKQGTLEIVYGQTVLKYTPTSTSYVGKDVFAYTVSDGKGGKATAQVIVVYKSTPKLKITKPSDGATLPGGKTTLEWTLTGCNLSGPSTDKNGCRIHLYVDGDYIKGYFDKTAIPISGLKKGQHKLALRVHVNSGGDGPWKPEVYDAINVTVP